MLMQQQQQQHLDLATSCQQHSESRLPASCLLLGA
jgi:hypothetical protein